MRRLKLNVKILRKSETLDLVSYSVLIRQGRLAKASAYGSASRPCPGIQDSIGSASGSAVVS